LQKEEEASSFKYLPINHIKQIVKNRLTICADDEERVALEDCQSTLKDIWTPTATETRKAFFPLLSDAFNCKPKNLGGGCWAFEIIVSNKKMNLVLDFGGRFRTFNYYVDVDPEKFPKSFSVTYETILGFHEPDWDLMRPDLLSDHARVFLQIANKILEAVASTIKC